MRLIDADAYKATMQDINGAYWEDILDNMMPTVDAVPVIRCKDCRFFKERYLSIAGNDVPAHWCEEWFGNTRESGFCHMAERQRGKKNADYQARGCR